MDCVASWSKVRLLFSLDVHAEYRLWAVGFQKTTFWPNICHVFAYLMLYGETSRISVLAFGITTQKINFTCQRQCLVSHISLVTIYILIYLKLFNTLAVFVQ